MAGASWEDAGAMPRAKHFRDVCHGDISLSPLSVQLVDTAHFQRLRDLKQLGVSSYVFPAAEHTRFSHSLGVAHLARCAIDRLRQLHPELDIRPCQVLWVELGGLLHDVGHGPFSHMFESHFLPKVLPVGHAWHHEDMSSRLVEYLVERHHIDLDAEGVRRVQDVIGCGKVDRRCCWTDTEYMLQIVANEVNGVDVDKVDYLWRDSRMTNVGTEHKFTGLMANARVVDSHLCFMDSMGPKLKMLFDARASMHEEVYTHRTVKALELMVVDAMLAAEPVMRFSTRIHSPDDFLTLNDGLLSEIQFSTGPELAAARAILQRLRSRRTYRWVAEVALAHDVPRSGGGGGGGITAQHVAARLGSLPAGVALSEDDLEVVNVKIDLSKGDKDPLDCVQLYYPDGSKGPCPRTLPYRSCVQRKVRLYLKRETESSAVMIAVQQAFKLAVRDLLSSDVKVVCAGTKHCEGVGLSPVGAPCTPGIKGDSGNATAAAEAGGAGFASSRGLHPRQLFDETPAQRGVKRPADDPDSEDGDTIDADGDDSADDPIPTQQSVQDTVRFVV